MPLSFVVYFCLDTSILPELLLSATQMHCGSLLRSYEEVYRDEAVATTDQEILAHVWRLLSQGNEENPLRKRPATNIARVIMQAGDLVAVEDRMYLSLGEGKYTHVGEESS